MENQALQHTCDGCGDTVAPEHVRARIARLEMATRFRPLHIHAVLLLGSPPVALEDSFYQPGVARVGSAWGDQFFRAVMTACGVASSEKLADAFMLEFQRRGLFLAYVKECPAAAGDSWEKFAEPLVRRLRFSYKPKCVLVLDRAAGEVSRLIPPESLPGIRMINPAEAIEVPREAAGDWAGFEQSSSRQMQQLSLC